MKKILEEQCGVPHPSNMPENIEVQSADNLVKILENKLVVGKVIKDIDNAYLLYCQYARAKGFSVRMSDERRFNGTTEIQPKEFKCSCEGVKDEKCSNNKIPIYQKLITRTDCKARLRVSRNKEGEWKVSRFVVEHNHEMISPDQTHLLRSACNISLAQKSILEAIVNIGIHVSTIVLYLKNEAQRPQNLGFISKDAYNHISSLKRQTKVENGDATVLLQHFINKSNKENYFYCNVQLDDDDRVLNFFFRDYRCVIDYEYFGDVMSFNTTYKTNKYDLIYVPFVGINHHKQNVSFGLAFLSHETKDSFEWLFKMFLDSMNGKEPEIIFTDQAQTMMNAIETTFPNSHHHLCQWHIDSNASSHFGSLNGDKEFLSKWHKLMSHCESEQEFEETWSFVMNKYNMFGHSWFKVMYKLRDKWSTPFSLDKFSVGLMATSRSEATNNVLKFVATKNTSLYEFVLNYEKIQNNWRAKKKAEDRGLHRF